MGYGNEGFTLIETLLATVILVVLLGISVTAAAYYRNYLKIARLDNAAREIYMAAENRAVLLANGRQLEGLMPGGGSQDNRIFPKGGQNHVRPII